MVNALLFFAIKYVTRGKGGILKKENQMRPILFCTVILCVVFVVCIGKYRRMPCQTPVINSIFMNKEKCTSRYSKVRLFRSAAEVLVCEFSLRSLFSTSRVIQKKARSYSSRSRYIFCQRSNIFVISQQKIAQLSKIKSIAERNSRHAIPRIF